jgi:hypothetical protein
VCAILFRAGSLAALAAGYLRSADFTNLSPSSQASYQVALKPVLAAHGHRLVRDLTKLAARHVVEQIGTVRPGMANLTKAVLSKVIAYAIEIGVRTDNPFAGLKPYRLGTYHTWTDAEIAQFERRWPLGTRERLAFALLLYTGQRGGDVVRMQRADITEGRIRVAQDKTRKGTTNELLIPIHPALARALQAGPVVGMTHIITDARGKPLQRLTKIMAAAVKLRVFRPDALPTVYERRPSDGWRKPARRRNRSRRLADTDRCRRLRGIPPGRTKRGWRKPQLPNCLTRKWNDLQTNGRLVDFQELSL